MKSQAVAMDLLKNGGLPDQDRTKPQKSELKDSLVADQGGCRKLENNTFWG